MIKEGRNEIIRQGPKGVVSVEHAKIVAHAIQTYVAILQINGDIEVQNKDIIALLTNFLSTMINPIRPHKLWNRIKTINPSSFSVKMERIVEFRRQQWTTFKNLDLWCDPWQLFLLNQCFATLDAPVGLTKEGEVYISNAQKRRIINLDETAISLDGSEGKSGGRPAVSYVASGVSRPGTAVNKSGGCETFVCGSNALGEPLPPTIIFSSKAQEENRAVRLTWVNGLPKVTVQFDHETEVTIST